MIKIKLTATEIELIHETGLMETFPVGTELRDGVVCIPVLAPDDAVRAEITEKVLPALRLVTRILESLI